MDDSDRNSIGHSKGKRRRLCTQRIGKLTFKRNGIVDPFLASSSSGSGRVPQVAADPAPIHNGPTPMASTTFDAEALFSSREREIGFALSAQEKIRLLQKFCNQSLENIEKAKAYLKKFQAEHVPPVPAREPNTGRIGEAPGEKRKNIASSIQTRDQDILTPDSVRGIDSPFEVGEDHSNSKKPRAHSPPHGPRHDPIVTGLKYLPGEFPEVDDKSCSRSNSPKFLQPKPDALAPGRTKVVEAVERMRQASESNSSSDANESTPFPPSLANMFDAEFPMPSQPPLRRGSPTSLRSIRTQSSTAATSDTESKVGPCVDDAFNKDGSSDKQSGLQTADTINKLIQFPLHPKQVTSIAVTSCQIMINPNCSPDLSSSKLGSRAQKVFVVYSGCADHRCRAFNALNGEALQILESSHKKSINSLVLSENAEAPCLYSGSLDRTVVAYSLLTGKKLHRIELKSKENDAGVNSLAISPDGLLFAGCTSGEIFVLSGKPGKKKIKEVLREQDSSISCLLVSKVDEVYRLISSSIDGTVCIRSLDNYEIVDMIASGHSKPVLCISLHRGMLYTGSADKTVQVIDLATRKKRHQKRKSKKFPGFEQHANSITGITTCAIPSNEAKWVSRRTNHYNNCDTTLVTASFDGTLKFHTISDERQEESKSRMLFSCDALKDNKIFSIFIANIEGSEALFCCGNEGRLIGVCVEALLGSKGKPVLPYTVVCPHNTCHMGVKMKSSTGWAAHQKKHERDLQKQMQGSGVGGVTSRSSARNREKNTKGGAQKAQQSKRKVRHSDGLRRNYWFKDDVIEITKNREFKHVQLGSSTTKLGAECRKVLEQNRKEMERQSSISHIYTHADSGRCLELLGLENMATPEDITRKYREMARKWHPDRHQGDIKAATEMMQNLNYAHKILTENARVLF